MAGGRQDSRSTTRRHPTPTLQPLPLLGRGSVPSLPAAPPLGSSQPPLRPLRATEPCRVPGLWQVHNWPTPTPPSARFLPWLLPLARLNTAPPPGPSPVSPPSHLLRSLEPCGSPQITICQEAEMRTAGHRPSTPCPPHLQNPPCLLFPPRVGPPPRPSPPSPAPP